MYGKHTLFKASEFIGKRVKVVFSPCVERIGIEGTIIDERKEVFVIHTNNKYLTIPKRYHVFEFAEGKIKGDDIAFRPEDRIKKLLR
jgi:RNase P/RNase MRP subunit p29